jgi:probable rRNA maturation factor
MLNIENETDFKFNTNIIEEIANRYSKKEIEILITDDTNMREINKNTRGIDSSTDVLSFPLEPLEHTPLGSIVINADKVAEVSKELGHTSNDEFNLMFIHGLLHLLGYDHETDKGEMRDEEEKIIKTYNLPKSLILRTEDKK